MSRFPFVQSFLEQFDWGCSEDDWCFISGAESVSQSRQMRWKADPRSALIKVRIPGADRCEHLSSLSFHTKTRLILVLPFGAVKLITLVFLEQQCQDSQCFRGSAEEDWPHFLRSSPGCKTHRLSLCAWQLSHTLTGWSQPREGTGLMCVEQGPHTPCPQALQWCLDMTGVKVLEHWWHWVMSWSGTQ